jgi:hypothetical protein
MVEIIFIIVTFKNDANFIPHKSNDIASKKNGRPEFAGQPLRRRTDEEIIRLIIRLTFYFCKNPANLSQKIKNMGICTYTH